MTENENTDRDQRDDTTERKSGALIGRFLAVGLFVALGTFAVIQSLSGNPPAGEGDPESETTLATNEVGDKKDSPAEKIKQEKLKAENPASRVNSGFGSTVASTKPSMPESPVIKQSKSTFAKTLKPATPIVVTPQQSTGTFGSGSQKSPPPNRIAQLDSGSARSSFGIGGPATPPGKTVSQQLGSAVDGFKQKVGDAGSAAVNRFNQLGKGVKDTASDVANRTRSAFGSTSSRFGKPSTPPAKPIVVSSGSPLTQSSPIRPIEAKSSLDSANNRRPFSDSPAKPGGFQSKSLSPISSTATKDTRKPFAGTPIRSVSTTRKAGTPAGLPRDPFSKSQQSRSTQSSQSSRSTSRGSSFAAAPTTGSPSSAPSNPVASAGRVSGRPGDRQYEGVQSPSMIIQKFSPREIQVNQTADFEVKIRNVGRIAVDNVLIVDQVPEGARFIDANPRPSSQSRTGELQWKIGTMKPGEERTILLQVQPTEPGEIGSVAQFYFGGRATNRTKVTQPKLKISHTADPKILIGDNVVFDVIVENTGNGPAKDVVIQEEVPELLEYQDGSRELEYEVGTLLPGQSRRVQLGLKAARIGRLRNVMFASAKGGLQAKHETDVEIIAPRLSTSSQGPTRRYIQRQVAHTFTVTNNGTAAATNLRLIARLPGGLRFVKANNRGRYDRNSHAVVWQMRDLAAGGSGDVEITTTPVEAGQQNIRFEAAADLNQKSETEQALNVEHLVDVFFDIDDVIDPIEIGADTRYQIRLVNQGTQAASNVQLQVDFPQGLQPTSVDGDLRNQIRGQQILFEPITSLRPGEEVKVLVQATGRSAGDHRIVVNMKADGRDTPVSKQETTRVYADR